MITSTKDSMFQLKSMFSQTEVCLHQIAFDKESAIPTDNSAVCSLL